MPTAFTERVIGVIRGIPHGKVMTFGGVAKAGGNPGGARQVVRILHSCSKKYDLPWHRVVNAKGRTAFTQQNELLEGEGVGFIDEDVVDLKLHLVNE